MKRPRRRLGEELYPVLTCPLCLSDRVGAMRWGEKTTRFACDTCGLRFSIDLGQMARTLREPKRSRAFETIGQSLGFDVNIAMKAGRLSEGAAEELGEFIEQARKWKPPDNDKKPPRRVNGRGRDRHMEAP